MSAVLRVKLLSRIPAVSWRHQLPDGDTRWGGCRFSFDPEARDYDWLVVYDDLPERSGFGRERVVERLACAREHTLLVTSEPSSIKIYGRAYTLQFGQVLTSQEEWALPHPRRIHSQPALHWFYGVGSHHVRSFAHIAKHAPMAKNRDISMVYSAKRMRHTLHHKRERFMRVLMERLPQIEVWGRGHRPLDDKAQALDDYRYHIALENHIAPHHWTEKLADAFLGACLPIYSGCTNVEDYFPAESLMHIDTDHIDAAVEIIRTALATNEYEKRRSAILEARRRVLYEYNFFAVVSRIIEAAHQQGRKASLGEAIYSRHALRRQKPLVALQDLVAKTRARLHYLHHQIGR